MTGLQCSSGILTAVHTAELGAFCELFGSHGETLAKHPTGRTTRKHALKKRREKLHVIRALGLLVDSFQRRTPTTTCHQKLATTSARPLGFLYTAATSNGASSQYLSTWVRHASTPAASHQQRNDDQDAMHYVGSTEFS
jgi:hypothetical protein